MRQNFKCGYVAVLGRPNAGKSSLVNFLVGEEVAVVSHRQQTTRNQILGIKTGENYQIIFIDTPGVHHSKNNLDKFMMKNVRSASAAADVVLYLFDCTKDIEDEEKDYIKNLKTKCEKVILVATKTDKIAKKEQKNAKILQNIGEIFKEDNFFAISSVTGDGIESLEKYIVELLPEGDAIFGEDEYTDKSVRFLLAEKIRGLLLEKLDNEIPHGVAVVVTDFDEDENKVLAQVEIVCEREQHKGIIIGRGGENLKQIGQAAREYLEKLLDKKCTIKLFVKVDKNWREKNVGNYYN